MRRKKSEHSPRQNVQTNAAALDRILDPPKASYFYRKLALCGPILPPIFLLFKLWKGGQAESDPTKDFAGRGTTLTIVSSLCALAFWMTCFLIPPLKTMTIKANLWGYDFGRRGTSEEKEKIAESLGIVSGTVYLVTVTLLGCIFARSHEILSAFNAALASITFMLFLGFADDVLELRWRYKLILPAFASLPLLCYYYSSGGSTHVLFPSGYRIESVLEPIVTSLSPLFDFFGLSIVLQTSTNGVLLDLDLFYFFYAGALGIFCTNSINIYSGINGLEAGQSYVIACAILTMNLIEVVTHQGDGTPGYSPPPYVANHLLSAMLIGPFIAVNAGLLRFNWYPAQCFVGDTFCYFAGMTFAVSGVMGHFTKTLLLLMIPQLSNFILSWPQLVPRFIPGSIPCPRHRLPKFNSITGLREPSCASTGQMNRTLLNVVLSIFGPMKEETLCSVLLLLQWLSCSAVLGIRYAYAFMKE
eukprot:g812.t1